MTSRIVSAVWTGMGILAFWLSWPFLFVLMYHTTRVRVLVHHNEQILLVRNWYGSGQWQLPGGGLKRGESPENGARRELMEEISLRITPSQLTQLTSLRVVHEKQLRFTCQTFSCQLSDREQVKPGHYDIDAYSWVSVDEALQEYHISTSARRALTQWKKR
ncbi:hypothetical protein BH23PAT2_BH23PAT2_06710 [soil metagenome]